MRSPHLPFAVTLLLAVAGKTTQAFGARARAAHAAAAQSGGVKLPISEALEKEAASLQSWLEEAYDRVDYIKALEEAEAAPALPFGMDEESTTYGEFPLAFLSAILDRLAPPPTATFCDLGSGRGQIVLSAAKLRPWASCRGVEICPELHFIATGAARIVSDDTGDTSVSFELGDIYEAPFRGSGAGEDVVFCYATCLEVCSAGSLHRLAQSLQGLPKGTTVVTINRPLLPLRDGGDDGEAPTHTPAPATVTATATSPPFRPIEVLRGPNPETEAEGLLSAAYVWRRA